MEIEQLPLATLVLLAVLGCATTSIPMDEYSPLRTPQETYDFAKKAVARDDPEAFYYCLSSETQQNFPLSDVKLGWSLAGSYFYIFLDSKLKEPEGVAIPAPETSDPATAKVTLVCRDLEASFLFVQEESRWKLMYPSPYALPNLQQLKPKIRMPWRNTGYVRYQYMPEQWYRPAGRYEVQQESERRPGWRSDENHHYQTLPEQWCRSPGKYPSEKMPAPRTLYWRTATF